MRCLRALLILNWSVYLELLESVDLLGGVFLLLKLLGDHGATFPFLTVAHVAYLGAGGGLVKSGIGIP